MGVWPAHLLIVARCTVNLEHGGSEEKRITMRIKRMRERKWSTKEGGRKGWGLKEEGKGRG